ncbi:hypothetical protein CDG81_02160 [Actinopolyspora erythraea]|uniref:DUF2812 domain-containing protein n=1 Tax=Actinopolyspora erythraea TaxID=414996 RepID=A0A099D318_9ACTN|nr:hypothetical protein [Actinopolyspora erythraea]ASU77314.1 hypothetical protein CDG81_02160 [Actinopolyspora erythraea]KGI80197.1 hypothetical protein IL38_18815 [Actinopolyspora erythraea]
MTDDAGSPTEAEFLRRLENTRTNLAGVAYVDIPYSERKISLGHYRGLVRERGWRVTGVERGDEGMFRLVLERSGSTSAPHILGPTFIEGPSLDELRGNESALLEAERVRRETGVDVLSDSVLDGVRREHVRLRRRYVRLGRLAALPALLAFVTLMFSLVALGDGNPEAVRTLLIVSAVSAVVFVLSLWPTIRAARARRAAVADYKAGYERVVAAALGDNTTRSR